MSTFPEPVYCKVRPDVGEPLGLPVNYYTEKRGEPWCRVVLVSFTSSTVRVQRYDDKRGEAVIIEVPREAVKLPAEAKDAARSLTVEDARRQLGLC